MTWPELRAARQLAGAPTLIRKISNWWEANVRATRSPPPCRSPSRHSCSFCFSVGFHRLTWLGCGSNLARPPWQPASERLFNQSCNAPGLKSHQLPSSGDKSRKQQLLAALIWVPSSRKNEQNGADGVSPWTKFFSLPASGWNHFSYMLKIPFPNAFCGLFCCMDVWDKCRGGMKHFVSILSMLYWWNFMQLATGGGCFSPSLCGTLMFTDDTDTMLPVAFQKHKRRYLHSSTDSTASGRAAV